MPIVNRLRAAALALAYSAAAALALAYSAAAAADPAAPPVIARQGTVAAVLVDAGGAVDGLLLGDGTLVRFTPQSVVDADALGPGLAVQVAGEPATTPSGLTLFAARVTAATRTLVNPARRRSGPAPARALRPLTVRGRVRLLLTDADGVIDGLLLEDGTVVHAGPRARLSRLGIAPASELTVTGTGGRYRQGTSLQARTVQLGHGAVYVVDSGAAEAPPAR